MHDPQPTDVARRFAEIAVDEWLMPADMKGHDIAKVALALDAAGVREAVEQLVQAVEAMELRDAHEAAAESAGEEFELMRVRGAIAFALAALLGERDAT